MKKAFLFIGFEVLLLMKVYCGTYIFNNYIINMDYLQTHKREIVYNLYYDEINKEFKEEEYYSFINNQIPEKFVNSFYKFTNKNKNLGIEIIGIGFHESAWKVFQGPVNKNGSIDLGPLMLNSNNINNEDFMKLYANNIEEYIDDIDVYYMLICINYYKDLRKTNGSFNALQIYNGGYRVLRESCDPDLKNTVIRYANTVYSYINDIEKQWKDFQINFDKDNYILNLIIDKYVMKYNKEYEDCIVFNPKLKDNDIHIYPIEYTVIGFKLIYEKHLLVFDKDLYRIFILMKWPIITTVYRVVNGEVIKVIEI